jgi:hypothetical protein
MIQERSKLGHMQSVRNWITTSPQVYCITVRLKKRKQKYTSRLCSILISRRNRLNYHGQLGPSNVQEAALFILSTGLNGPYVHARTCT